MTNSIPIHEWNSPQVKNRENYPTWYRLHEQNRMNKTPAANITLLPKDEMLPLHGEQNKDVHYHQS
jgi:hypothetical protein